MIYIAICDDDVAALNKEHELIIEICRNKNIDVSIGLFYSPKDLLMKVELYDIVLLDIEMDEMNGVDLAECINKIHPECHKIFITNYSVYLDRAFDVSADRFLTKPVDKERLTNGIEHIIEQMRSKSKLLHVTLQNSKTSVDIEISTILFIENSNRHTRIVSSKYGDFKVKEKFSILKSQIKNEVKYFSESNQSILINLKYVIGYTKDNVIIQCDGKTFKMGISRRKYKAFDKAVFDMGKEL